LSKKPLAASKCTVRILVEPALAAGGVDPHDDDVVGAVIDDVGDIVFERRIAAQVAAQIVAMERHHGVAEHAVEPQDQPAPRVAGGDVQHPPVPADAGLGVGAAERLGAKLDQLLDVVAKRQLDRPVVGQIHGAPRPVVELGGRGREQLARLGEHLAAAIREVALEVVGIAELEVPATVDQELLAAPGGGGRGTRCGELGRGTAGGQQRCARRGGAGLQNITTGPTSHGTSPQALRYCFAWSAGRR
jgi:hypothetical protein